MSAIAEIPLQSRSASPLAQKFASLNGGQKFRLGAGLLLLLAIVVAAWVMSRQGDYRVLFANLNDKDGGAIVAQLSQMNVPYKYAEGGGAIMVPADKVHDIRLRLASQGLPKGAVSGFEMMEANRFGMTQFQERLTFQRGLEGELTRSIQALSSVQSARVHLALPNQNGFFREQQKPSASVLVSLHPGRTLDRTQLAGIVHLVASSVPEMNTTAVSVLDDSGKLLSSPPDGSGSSMGGDAQQLQYVQQIEQLYARRIMDMLEPVVGRQNVKAQVTADVDFSQTESTSESHKPNQTADSSAIRSQQLVETSGSQGGAAGGIPGATSNQPAAASTAPINGANPAPTAGAAQSGTAAANTKRESTINYEVDKTVRVTRAGSGVVKRLSAAVVVNYQSSTEGAGKVVTKPLSTQQLEQMTALVRESIGFSKDRGDSVNLMNTPFQVDAVVNTELPLWRQPEVVDLTRSFAWPVGMLLLIGMVFLGVVRPVLKGLGRPAELNIAGGSVNALEAEQPQRPALPAPNSGIAMITPEQMRLNDARVMAKQNPIAVANIVKSWVSGDAPA